ncbi:MAG: endonuclease/exonuclease/phosphatase family protein [Bacteroidales bacterium]
MEEYFKARYFVENKYYPGVMKKVIRPLLRFVLTVIILFALFLFFFSIVEYRPKYKKIVFSAHVPDTMKTGKSYSSFIWNIGYSGLGGNMDFFYDGGENVRDTKENVSRNLRSISGFVTANDSIDFFMLQEVDLLSKRSYRTNQFSRIDSLLQDHSGFLGINYNTPFVPVPVSRPLGKVKSGIATYSNPVPSDVVRYGFKGNYAWPKRLFMLKRCFLVCSFPVRNGKTFYLVNIHNSAYDDGSLREEQLKVLETFAGERYEKGDYILLGGDWNQSPGNFQPLYDQPFDTLNLSYLPNDFLNTWERVFSDSIPSNRRITFPYFKGETLTTTIDYFIASPNITVHSVELHDLEFEFSDHQPLMIRFTLNE